MSSQHYSNSKLAAKVGNKKLIVKRRSRERESKTIIQQIFQEIYSTGDYFDIHSHNLVPRRTRKDIVIGQQSRDVPRPFQEGLVHTCQFSVGILYFITNNPPHCDSHNHCNSYQYRLCPLFLLTTWWIDFTEHFYTKNVTHDIQCVPGPFFFY